MEILSASEARNKTLENKKVIAEQYFELIIEKVNEAVSKGYYKVEFKNTRKFPQNTEKLEDLGYRVKELDRYLVVEW